MFSFFISACSFINNDFINKHDLNQNFQYNINGQYLNISEIKAGTSYRLPLLWSLLTTRGSAETDNMEINISDDQKLAVRLIRNEKSIDETTLALHDRKNYFGLCCPDSALPFECGSGLSTLC